MELLFYFGLLPILKNLIVMRSTSILSSGVHKDAPTLKEKATEKLDVVPLTTSCMLTSDVLTPFHSSVAFGSFEYYPTETLLGNDDEKETLTTTEWNVGWLTNREREENDAWRLESHADAIHLTPPISTLTTSDGWEMKMKRREEEEETNRPSFASSRPSPMRKEALLLHAGDGAVNRMENEEEETSSEGEEDSFCVDPASPLFRPRLSEDWRRERRSTSQPRTSSSGFLATGSHPNGSFSFPLKEEKKEERKDNGRSSQTFLSHPFTLSVLPRSPGVGHPSNTKDVAYNGGHESTFIGHRDGTPLLRLDDVDDTSEEEETQSTATQKERKSEKNTKEPHPPQGRPHAFKPKGSELPAEHQETGARHNSVLEPSKMVQPSSSPPLIRLDDDTDDEEEKPTETSVARRSRVRSPAIQQEPITKEVAPTRSGRGGGAFGKYRRVPPTASSIASSVYGQTPPLPLRVSRVRSYAKSTVPLTPPTSTSLPVCDLLFDRNRTSPVASLFLQHRNAALREEGHSSSDGTAWSSPLSLPALYTQRVALHHSLSSLFCPPAYATKTGFRAAVASTFASSHILPPNTFWPLFLSTTPSKRSSRSSSGTTAPTTSCFFPSTSSVSSCANAMEQSLASPFSASSFPVEYVGEGSFGLVWKAAAPLFLPTRSDDDIPIVVPSTATTARTKRNPQNGYHPKKDPPPSCASAVPVYRPVCIKSCPLFVSSKAYREDAVTTLREVAILTLLQLLEEEEEEEEKKKKKCVITKNTSPSLPPFRGSDHDSFGVPFPSPSNAAHGKGTRTPRTLPLYSAFYVPGVAEALPPEVRDAVCWRRECQKRAQAIAADEIRQEEQRKWRGGGGTSNNNDDGSSEASKKEEKRGRYEEREDEGEGMHAPHGTAQGEPKSDHTPTTSSSCTLFSTAGMSFEARVEHILQHRLAAMEQKEEEEEEDKKEGGEDEESGKKKRIPRGRPSLTRREKRSRSTLTAKHSWFTTSTGEKMRATAARQRFTAVKCPSFLSLSTYDVLQCDGTLFMVMEYCHGDVEHLARQSFPPPRASLKRENELEVSPAPFHFASSNPSWDAPTQPLPSRFPLPDPSCPPCSSLEIASATPPLLPPRHPTDSNHAEERKENGETAWGSPPTLLDRSGTNPFGMPLAQEKCAMAKESSNQGGKYTGGGLGLSPSAVREGGRMQRRRGEPSESALCATAALPPPPRRRKRRRWHRHWYRRPLPLDLLFSIASCVSDTLAGLHALGLLHLDVKPSNILYTIGMCPSGEKDERVTDRETITHQRANPHEVDKVSAVTACPDPPFAPYTFYLSDFGNCQLLPIPPLAGTHSTCSTLSISSTQEKVWATKRKGLVKKTKEEARVLGHPVGVPQESSAFPLASLSSNAAEEWHTESAVSNAIGTYAYMDGAALADLRASTATDCFSLGATLFELAFGRRIYGLVHQYRQVRTFCLLPMTPLLPTPLIASDVPQRHEEREVPPPPQLDEDGEAKTMQTTRNSPSRNMFSLSQLPSLPSMTLGLDEEEEEKDREWYAALATFYGLHHHHLWTTEVIDDELIGVVLRYFAEENHTRTLPPPCPHPLSPSMSPLPTTTPLASTLTAAASSSLASPSWDSFLWSSQSALYTTTVAPQQRTTVAGVKLWLSTFFHEILYPLLSTNWDQRMTAEQCALRLREKNWKQMLSSSSF